MELKIWTGQGGSMTHNGLLLERWLKFGGRGKAFKLYTKCLVMDRKWKSKLVSIRHGYYLGKAFKKDMPMMADAFRSCLTVGGILYEFDIDEHYDGSIHSKIKGITHALGGYHGNIRGMRHYDGLMPLEEYDRVKRLHWSRNAKKLAIERGQVPWVPRIIKGDEIIPSELETAYNLTFDKRFKWGKNVSNLKIAEYLDDKYHRGDPVRNRSTVSLALRRLGEKIRNGEEPESIFAKNTIPFELFEEDLWLDGY
jgi:hypothetical protein